MTTDRDVRTIEIQIPGREGLRPLSITPHRREPRESVMRCYHGRRASETSTLAKSTRPIEIVAVLSKY